MDDFNFDIVIFTCFDKNDRRSHSYGVYISHLFRFSRVCYNVGDFNNRNNLLNSQVFKARLSNMAPRGRATQPSRDTRETN